MELPEAKIFATDLTKAESVAVGDIEFKNLAVRWSDWSIEALDFHVEAGEIVEIRGPRIAVSLALHAAAGFAAPASGSVLVGGKALAAYDEEAFRRAVVLIPNEPELFDGTLTENLTMFDPARELKAREWADRLDLTDLYRMGSSRNTVARLSVRSTMALCDASHSLAFCRWSPKCSSLTTVFITSINRESERLPGCSHRCGGR